jgi:putative ABC transport system permease protein
MAGPFAVAVLETVDLPDAPGLGTSGPLTVVGRPDPAGPVDRVDLWKGRWATSPGEIVLNIEPDPEHASWFPLGGRLCSPTARR